MALIIIADDQFNTQAPAIPEIAEPSFQTTDVHYDDIPMAAEATELTPEEIEAEKRLTRLKKNPDKFKTLENLHQLVQRFKNSIDTTEREDILDKIYEYPYDGGTIGQYVASRLAPFANQSGISTNVKQDANSLIFQILSRKTNLSDFFGAVGDEAKYFYKQKNRPKGAAAEAIQKMGPYARYFWFGKDDPQAKPVEGAENVDDWEAFKPLAWEQYKKDRWITKNGTPVNVEQAMNWLNQQIDSRQDDILGGVNKLKMNNHDSVGPNGLQKIKSILMSANVKLPPDVAALSAEMLYPGRKGVGPLYWEKVRAGLGKGGQVSLDTEVSGKEGDTTSLGDYLTPGAVKEDDIYGDATTIKDMKGVDANQLASLRRELGEDLNVEAENRVISKIDEQKHPDAKKYLYRYYNSTNPEVRDAALKSIFDLIQNSSVGTDARQEQVEHQRVIPKKQFQPKEKTGPATPTKITQDSPEYKGAMESIVQKTFDPSADPKSKFMYDLGMMVANMIPENKGTSEENRAARVSNKKMRDDFKNSHQEELNTPLDLSYSDDSDVDPATRYRMAELEVKRTFDAYVSNPNAQAELGTTASALNDLKYLFKVAVFSAKTDLITKRG